MITRNGTQQGLIFPDNEGEEISSILAEIYTILDKSVLVNQIQGDGSLNKQ